MSSQTISSWFFFHLFFHAVSIHLLTLASFFFWRTGNRSILMCDKNSIASIINTFLHLKCRWKFTVVFVRLQSKDVLITADWHFDIIKLIGFVITLFVMHFRITTMDYHYKENEKKNGLAEVVSGGMRHKKKCPRSNELFYLYNENYFAGFFCS